MFIRQPNINHLTSSISYQQKMKKDYMDIADKAMMYNKKTLQSIQPYGSDDNIIKSGKGKKLQSCCNSCEIGIECESEKMGKGILKPYKQREVLRTGCGLKQYPLIGTEWTSNNTEKPKDQFSPKHLGRGVLNDASKWIGKNILYPIIKPFVNSAFNENKRKLKMQTGTGRRKGGRRSDLDTLETQNENRKKKLEQQEWKKSNEGKSYMKMVKNLTPKKRGEWNEMINKNNESIYKKRFDEEDRLAEEQLRKEEEENKGFWDYATEGLIKATSKIPGVGGIVSKAGETVYKGLKGGKTRKTKKKYIIKLK